MSRLSSSAVTVVAGHEVRSKLRQKSFLWSSVFLVVAAVVGVVAVHLLQDRGQHYDVAVTDPDAAAVVEAASQRLEADDPATGATAESVASAAEAEAEVREGRADAALLSVDGGFQLVGDADVDPDLGSALTVAVQSVVVDRNAQAQGVDVAELSAGTDVGLRLLDPNADETGERGAVAFVMVLLFFSVAVTFGMMIAQGVTVEKESRVVEILAAAIPLRSLLWGKIIANTGLALAQVALTLGAAWFALWATDLTGFLDVLTSTVWWYLAFFVLGFVALAAVWAVAGSMAARQQDLNTTTTPVMILLFAPYFISTIASDTVVAVTSVVPVASAMVMPARLAQETVPLWQVLLALGLNVVATVVLVRIGAVLYERTVMRTERVTGFRELVGRS